MEAKSNTLTIESRQPGLRVGAAVGLVFVPALSMGWCRHFYGQGTFLSRAAFWGGVVFGIGGLLGLIDVLHSRWRLNVGPEEVRVQRRGIFGTRRWVCPLQTFQVGEVEAVEEGDDFSHRFIRLTLSGQVVRFMEGHRARELEVVRERIVVWRNRAGAA